MDRRETGRRAFPRNLSSPIIRMMIRTVIFLVCALFLCSSFSAGAQDAETGTPASPGPAPEPVPLSRAFRSLSLGMSLDELKAGLAGDGLFAFRGDRDVSFLPQRDQSLIETTGSSFIRRAFFQLRDGEVFIMGFALNTAIVDHYSVFTSLVKKYGEPSSLDPRQAVWERDGTRISIERPLTVKYMDMRVFNGIIDEAALAESREIRLREEFLDEF
ncbi:MAG: hypothetical protein LBL44_00170 [Treponema sp.]|nr:hypothetical protein [Treponema sp.]